VAELAAVAIAQWDGELVQKRAARIADGNKYRAAISLCGYSG
jgi:hypothetical protein